MFSATFLGFLSVIPYGVLVLRTCIPNTQFQMNGRICYCDGLGQWSEANCEIARSKTCHPGQIIWEDCQQCICQEDGTLHCISTPCSEIRAVPNDKEIDIGSLLCLPFLTYYINCSLCVCPASGKMSEARCAKDAACPYKDETNFLDSVKKNVCIPKVMYLFPCLQCTCSDDGFFIINKCVEHCPRPQFIVSTRKCIPDKFYRNECNVCLCPKNGIPDDDNCSKDKCNNRFQLYSLENFKNVTAGCHRSTFTVPKCIYCECNQNGQVNKNLCLESECRNLKDHIYGTEINECNPGEIIPYCTECLCLRNGITDPLYCTEVCSHQHKLMILNKAINDSLINHKILDLKTLQKSISNDICEPSSVYFEDGKYCLCPDNGNTKFKLCTSTVHKNSTEDDKFMMQKPGMDFSGTCDPSTFVDYDCNTCYCQKNGRIDPKWCTYDDCEAKKITQTRFNQTLPESDTCVPGSILNQDCNFCICPKTGITKEKICTTNNCTGFHYSGVGEKFHCEPLTYFNVDCNTCYCPDNGIKNVAKCTTNICERSFLRSDVCVPGDLFSMECNVCVCPPNGDKSGRVCTEHSCSDADTPWKKIFKLSQSLMTNQLTEDTARSLELCFPGEEFTEDCKLCVCPDMGLRVYATCTPMLCNDVHKKQEITSDVELAHISYKFRSRREVEEVDDFERDGCMTYNLSRIFHQYPCTPGSEYIMRCKKCICPYAGSIMNFCRPLPSNVFCEQPYPGVNYLPLSVPTRRNDNNTTKPIQGDKYGLVHIPHNHTEHRCDKAGEVRDDCYICECVDHVIIEEHCYKSDSEACYVKKPTFLTNTIAIN